MFKPLFLFVFSHPPSVSKPFPKANHEPILKNSNPQPISLSDSPVLPPSSRRSRIYTEHESSSSDDDSSSSDDDNCSTCTSNSQGTSSSGTSTSALSSEDQSKSGAVSSGDEGNRPAANIPSPVSHIEREEPLANSTDSPASPVPEAAPTDGLTSMNGSPLPRVVPWTSPNGTSPSSLVAPSNRNASGETTAPSAPVTPVVNRVLGAHHHQFNSVHIY